MSPKITADHLARSAIVYVRQSTMAQVVGNLESQRRQYDLAGAARATGFKSVAVIDDDLGRSGSGTVERPGFERLVAMVCSGDIGAVYCLEASRLARNGRDWHHLIELCAVARRRPRRRVRSANRQRPSAAWPEGHDVGIRTQPDAAARPGGPRFEGAARRVPVHASTRVLLERSGQDRDRSRRACAGSRPHGVRQVPRTRQRAAGLPLVPGGGDQDARRPQERRRHQDRLEVVRLPRRHADPAQPAVRGSLCVRQAGSAHADRRGTGPQGQRHPEAGAGVVGSAARPSPRLHHVAGLRGEPGSSCWRTPT